jgi:hypothetical protein
VSMHGGVVSELRSTGLMDSIAGRAEPR